MECSNRSKSIPLKQLSLIIRFLQVNSSISLSPKKIRLCITVLLRDIYIALEKNWLLRKGVEIRQMLAD